MKTIAASLLLAPANNDGNQLGIADRVQADGANLATLKPWFQARATIDAKGRRREWLGGNARQGAARWGLACACPTGSAARHGPPRATRKVPPCRGATILPVVRSRLGTGQADGE
jgi:hypothetical protein